MLLSTDLSTELKNKEQEIHKLRNLINEVGNEKRVVESATEEKDEQIARLYKENLMLQQCREKAEKVARQNAALSSQNVELISMLLLLLFLQYEEQNITRKK